MEKVLLGFIIGMCTCIAVILITYSDENALKTKKKIEPELEIVIKNNISDTTYIYKQK